MNNIESYITQVKQTLLASSDECTKEKVLRLTSGSKCIGITVPKIRQISKTFKTEKNLQFSTVCDIADSLFEDEYREEILFAIFLISMYKKEVYNISWNRINSWLDYIDNWETCDQLSSNIVTAIIVDNPFLTKELLILAKSSNKWKRRFAVATIANMNHGGRQYPDETFSICETLLSDKEQVVSKAVGWALREISKKCPERTFNFLNQNKTVIPNRLLKESIELLPETFKAPLIK